jgi:ZIP family zinc transporter
MTYGTTALLGLAAGITIFIGLPIARMRALSKGVQGFLNALATGILLFLLWDILAKASEPVASALGAVRAGRANSFPELAVLFGAGIAIGLLALIYVNSLLMARLRRAGERAHEGPGAALAPSPTMPLSPAGRWLAMSIAAGLGLHNLSEGLAIGQAAASGALSLTGVLVIGFALHNLTEGFGIAAPLVGDPGRPSWRFLAIAGVVGGGPTFLGSLIGYRFVSPFVFVFFLTLAAGAIVYVVGEMFHVGRRMNTPIVFGWGIVLGFLAGYATDLVLTFLGA